MLRYKAQIKCISLCIIFYNKQRVISFILILKFSTFRVDLVTAVECGLVASTRLQKMSSFGVGVEIISPSHNDQLEVPITSLTKIVLRFMPLMESGTIEYVVPQHLLLVKKTL